MPWPAAEAQRGIEHERLGVHAGGDRAVGLHLELLRGPFAPGPLQQPALLPAAAHGRPEDRDPQEAVVDAWARPRADGVGEAVAIVGHDDRGPRGNHAEAAATTRHPSTSSPLGNSLTATATARPSVAAPATRATSAASCRRLIRSAHLAPERRNHVVPRHRIRWLEDAERLDVAVYAAIAATPTPAVDTAMSRLSRAADYSRLSLSAAALLALAGGRGGRRAALFGIASLAVTATVVNLAVKPLGRRRRPDRVARDVPLARHVRMPQSRSFPSGHAAGAFAFATGVGRVLPAAGLPLHALAALVAYSRIHTGVHYPGDVIAGAIMGAALAQLTTDACEHRLPACML
jgi:hypothetical protein